MDADQHSKPVCEANNEKRKSVPGPLNAEIDKVSQGPLNARIVRAAMAEDPVWARTYLAAMFRNDDKKADEGLRNLAREVAKHYDGSLETLFKANGGLGQWNDGEVGCVYSRSPLPAGGKGARDFTTHIDGVGVVHVGCRLQGPANGQKGQILLQFGADTGGAKRLLHEVDLGQSGSIGKTDWLTGKFTLPAGKDFAKTVHYIFYAQIIARDVWKQETIISSSTFTWHQ